MKGKPFVLLASLMMVLASCGTGAGSSSSQASSSSSASEAPSSSSASSSSTSSASSSSSSSQWESSSESSSSSQGKIEPVIDIDLEDGTSFEVSTFTEPAISVTPEECEYVVNYVKNDIDLGSDVPTEVGDYAIRVDIEESDLYTAASSFRTFKLRKFPTLTIYQGETAMENGLTFCNDALPDISAKAVYAGVDVTKEATITFKYTADEGATDLGETMPTEPGTYAVNAYIEGDEVYGDVHVWNWFKVSNPLVTPVVSILYGDAINTENGGAGSFTIGSIPDFSYEIKDAAGKDITDAIVEEYYQCGEDNISGKEAITVAGTYSYHVNVTADERYASLSRWVWFTVVEASLVTPTISILYGDAINTENGGAGSFTIGSIPDFSFTIKDDSGDAITDANVEGYYQFGDDRISGKDAITVAGTYSYHVKVTADSHYNYINRWVWFTVNEASLITPSITISYSGNDFAENTGGASFEIGSVPDFSFTIKDGSGKDITDVSVEGYYQYGDDRISGKDAITVAGSYSYHVKVTADSHYNSINRWYWFHVTEATA